MPSERIYQQPTSTENVFQSVEQTTPEIPGKIKLEGFSAEQTPEEVVPQQEQASSQPQQETPAAAAASEALAGLTTTTAAPATATTTSAAAAMRTNPVEESKQEESSVADLLGIKQTVVPTRSVDVKNYREDQPDLATINLATRDNYSPVSQAVTDNWMRDYFSQQDREPQEKVNKDFVNLPELHMTPQDESQKVAEHAAQQLPERERISEQLKSEATVGASSPLKKKYIYSDLPSGNFKASEDRIKEQTADRLASKDWSGNAVSEKGVASEKVDPIDIGIGLDVVKELVREPSNDFLKIVNEAIAASPNQSLNKDGYSIEDVMTESGAIRLMEDVNKLDIFIIVVKSPVASPESSQARRLRILPGRGAFVHPTQTKIWTLDFDGDDPSIKFVLFGDPEQKGAKTAASWLIGENGKHNLDLDFLAKPMFNAEDLKSFRGIFKAVFFKNLQKNHPEINLEKLAEHYYWATQASGKLSPDESWAEFLRELGNIANEVTGANESVEIAKENERNNPEGYSNQNVAIAAVEAQKAFAIEVSNLLKDLFDSSRLALRLQAGFSATAYNTTVDEYLEAITEDNNTHDDDSVDIDHFVARYVGDMSQGVMPPNFQEFVTSLHEFIGELPKKNIHFRLNAKYAKSINFSQFVFLASKDSDKGMHELYSQTLQAGVAMYMNSRATVSQKMLYVQKISRRRIFEQIGVIANHRSKSGNVNVMGFLRDFADAWNQEMVYQRTAFAGFSNALDVYKDVDKSLLYINPDKDGNYSLKSFITPIVSVYGELTLSQFFGSTIKFESVLNGFDFSTGYKGNQLLRHFETMTLREFSTSNHVIVKDGAKIKEKKFKARYLKRTDSKKKDSDGFITLQDVFYSIADRKTVLSKTYANSLLKIDGNSTEGLLVDFCEAFSDLVKKNPSAKISSRSEFLVTIKEEIAALHLSSPGVFGFFHMDDVPNFVNSSFWGQRISEIVLDDSALPGKYTARSIKEKADLVGGLRMAMLLRYRLRRIYTSSQKIEELKMSVSSYNEYLNDNDLPRQINKEQENINRELNALASSSPLWQILAEEVRGNTNAFIGTLMNEDVWSKESRKFFANKDFIGKHRSLMDVIADPYLSMTDKNKIACSVLKHNTGLLYWNDYEVPYQLDLDPDPSYTSLSLMAYREQPSMLSDIQTAHRQFNRIKSWKKAYEQIADDVKMARKLSESSDEPRLTMYLESLAKDPDYFLGIKEEFYADALVAQMMPTSKSGEKSKDELAVKGLHSAVVDQMGGMINGVERIDSKTFGIVMEYNMNPYYLIQCLADPTYSFTMGTSEGPIRVTREMLLGPNPNGKTDEERLWDFIEENPRIAALLRPKVMSASYDGLSAYPVTEESFYTGFSNSLHRTKADIFEGQIKSYLMDKPMFGAMVSFFVPINGRMPIAMAKEYTKMTKALQIFIMKAAVDVANGKPFVAKKFLEQQKITREKLIEDGKLDEFDASNFYYDLCRYLTNYVHSISRVVATSGITEKDINNIAGKLDFNLGDINLSFDQQSIALARNNRQALTAAKTELSTPVEGMTTTYHLGTGLYASAAKGRHIVIDGEMPNSYLKNFIGCRTNAGIFDGTNIVELEKSLPYDTPLFVEAPEGITKEDKTLDSIGQQITTVGRFIGYKRSYNTEEGNLKAAKAGDDGLDSISKISRIADKYQSSAEDNIRQVENAYYGTEENNPGDRLFQAKLALAGILQRADRLEGFTDMDLSDYMDLAEIMIKEIDGEAIQIRSLSQISNYIRHNFPQNIIENGSVDEIIQTALMLADEAGDMSLSKEDQRLKILQVFKSINSAPQEQDFKQLKSPFLSSPERIDKTLRELSTRREEEKVPWKFDGYSSVVSLSNYFRGKQNLSFLTSQERQSRGKEVIKRIKKDWSWNHKGKNYWCPINITRHKDEFVSKPVSDSKEGKKTFSAQRVLPDIIAPGPGNVWVLDSSLDPSNSTDAKKIQHAIEMCYCFGMTLAFEDEKTLGKFKDILKLDVLDAPFSEDFKIVPFFQIRMNSGAVSAPMSPANGDIDPGSYMLIVEDQLNLLGQADGQMTTSKAFRDRVHVGRGDVVAISERDLFSNIFNSDEELPNGMGKLKDNIESVSLASWSDIKRDIVDFNNPDTVFDLGLALSNRHIEDVVKKFGLQSKEFEKAAQESLEKFSNEMDSYRQLHNGGAITKEGVHLAEGRPDRIIAWAKCKVKGDSRNIYAPIILFPTGTSLSVPTNFDIESVTYSNGSFYIRYQANGDLADQWLKLHMKTNAAGKSVTILSDEDLGSLRNGIPIDGIVAAETNSGRNAGDAPRKGTMATLANAAKVWYSFNFANLDDSFPDTPDIKRALAKGNIPIYKWAEIAKRMNTFDNNLGRTPMYSLDKDIDAMIRKWVNVCVEGGTTNPTDLLANTFVGAAENGFTQLERTCRFVEYDFFFENDYEFEETLLRFYNRMIPALCPSSLELGPEDYNEEGRYIHLFRPTAGVDGDPYTKGLLQMLVPLPVDNFGQKKYFWSTCYLALGFLNDDFSGLHKVGLNGAIRSQEQYDAMIISGMRCAPSIMRTYLERAASPSFRCSNEDMLTYDYYKLNFPGPRSEE